MVPTDRVELERLQLERLGVLLDAVRPANGFQTRRLAAVGAPLAVGSLAEFSAQFPFTTKGELVAEVERHPPYGGNLTYSLERYTRFHQTSGTTGRPLRWLDTAESWGGMVEDWQRVFGAAGVGAEDRVMFAFTFGPFIGFWMAFEAAQAMGCLCLPGGGLSSAARLRMILDNEVTVVCCTPTYASRLAEVAVEERLDMGGCRVKRLLVAGEPGGSMPPVRARLSRLWGGARVYDHHGMTEVGPVSYECPRVPGRLHVMEGSFYAEVINPETGGRVGEGETGELVLTTLRRVASPVIRYRTGDVVEPLYFGRVGGVGACECGSVELGLEGGILGRADDMVIVRGVNVHPAALEGILQECGGVLEYQVEVFTTSSRTELSLRIEVQPGAGEPGRVAGRVQQALQSRLSLRIPVTPVPLNSLPRFEMKARRWVRRVSDRED
ncbi:MAG: hypothetical protein RI897_3590 [Verrucomicrobiota bacterium]|jgi:phenylacetate-CoA ligase